jgi:ABC-type glycerol-3-phosphate transport system permease component
VLIHLVLIAAVFVFMIPFAWMVVTSLKTDEEITGNAWVPALPVFRGDSPYARPAAAITKPDEADAAKWENILPRLRNLAASAVDKAPLPLGGLASSEKDFRDIAATTLVARLIPRMNTDLWRDDSAKIEAEFKRLITPESIADAMNDRLASFELRGLQVRTLDSHIYKIIDGGDIAAKWKVESGNAKLIAVDNAALLNYHFDSASDQPIVLRYDFDFPADPKEFHKLILAFKPDDSWHKVAMTLDLAGEHWTAARDGYLGTTRAASFFWQPPTFDDTTDRKRTWISLKSFPETRNPKPETRSATLRIIIKPSSTLAAIYGKIARNYVRVFDSVPFWRYVGNSVFLVALCTLGTLFSASFVAYAFARLNWPGRSFAFGLLLATMMLPGQVTMIPGFMIWRSVGLYNTLAPMWLPAFFGGAFFIFLMTQTMKTIPRELEEAARIDGLDALRTWWFIILPQTKPTLAAIAIMTFMGAWNEFMGPLIYLRDQSKFPLSLGLFGIRLENMTDWSLLMAANILMTAPVIIIFFLFQRYFIQGLTMSGMKG